MLSAVTVLTEDLSAQTIHRLLKQSKPEAQYRLRCIIESNKVIDDKTHILNIPATQVTSLRQLTEDQEWSFYQGHLEHNIDIHKVPKYTIY